MGTRYRRVAPWLALAFVAPGPTPSLGTTDGSPRSPAGDCRQCHQFNPALSHPVGVYPSMAVPAHLPLREGRLTCLTCHAGIGPAGPGGHHGGGVPGRDLCLACHRPERGATGDFHALLSPAHLDRARGRRGGGTPSRPDRESEGCLSCHDDTLAAGGTATLGPTRSAAGLVDGLHPIGVEQRSRGAGDHLRDAVGLDPSIRLFDGRLGCGSCHSPYARHDHLLVMPNRRSALCLACHDF